MCLVFSYAVELLGQVTMLIYPVRYVLPHIFACWEFPLEGKIRSLFCFDKIYIFAKLQLGHLDGLTSFRVQRRAGQQSRVKQGHARAQGNISSECTQEGACSFFLSSLPPPSRDWPRQGRCVSLSSQFPAIIYRNGVCLLWTYSRDCVRKLTRLRFSLVRRGYSSHLRSNPSNNINL